MFEQVTDTVVLPVTAADVSEVLAVEEKVRDATLMVQDAVICI